MTPKLINVLRLDSLKLEKAYYTDEGYLKDKPVLTRVGIFEYLNPDGSTRRELRLPEDVFDPESLASYEGKPIIITHDAGLVTKKNVHDHQIGTILSKGIRNGDEVTADIIIHDTDEMKTSGLKELSLGYNLDLDETPGVWNGKPYDAIQRNIRINHLALVKEARAGEKARLNIDSRDKRPNPEGGLPMKKTKKLSASRGDGVLSPEELAKAIEEYKARRAKGGAAKTDSEPDVKKTAVPDPAKDAPAKKTIPAKPVSPEKVDAEEAGTIEEKLQIVKDRRDRRDAEGEPETKEEAIGALTNQDEDMNILFDIIDTLIAERDFAKKDSAEPKAEPIGKKPIVAEDGEEEEIDHELTEDEEDDDLTEDGEEDDELTEDGEDEEDEEFTEDEEDEELTEDEDEEFPLEKKPALPKSDCGDKKLNADSIDRMIRQRAAINAVGAKLNLDGILTMPTKDAKKAVIKAVRPGIRLDGKSESYINAMFDFAVDEVEKSTRKDTGYQKRQMFNRDSAFEREIGNRLSSVSARNRMIERQKNKKEAK